MGPSRHRCMGTLCWWMGCMGTRDQRPAMMTVDFRTNPSIGYSCMMSLGFGVNPGIGCSGMMTLDFDMSPSLGCPGMMILGFRMNSNIGPWEARPKNAWALQSHVDRFSKGFAFRFPCALVLCAPFSFLNRYHLFVVVQHPDQGHLLLSY